MPSDPGLRWRPATRADLPALAALVDAAIARLLAPYLDADQVRASHAIMGIDTRLVDDGTYVVVERDGELAGCGGWSRRSTLYGGDHSAGRDDAPLDPATQPARIRAMYTDPAHTRRGVGRLVLDVCERAAAAAGFTRLELMATLAGEPLYAAAGYVVVEEVVAEVVAEVVEQVPGAAGVVAVPLRRMVKTVAATPGR